MSVNNALNLFMQQVANHGDTLAVVEQKIEQKVEQKQQYTYAELGTIALQVKHKLLSLNAKKIAIFLPAGAQAYATMFGTWMAGADYCPLNIEIPQEKIVKILDTYQPDLVICKTDTPSLNTRIKRLTWEEIESCTENSLDKNDLPTTATIALNNTAYTIFTSGTTGQAKGVQIPHSALANYLAWVRKDFPIHIGLRWSQHPNIGFDLSVLDIFGALCHGATLYPVQTAFARMFPARFIQKYQIEIWNSTPSVLDLLLQDNNLKSEMLSSLKLITVCGEPLNTTTLTQLFSCKPDLKIQNTYGPTEATVSCTAITLTYDNYIHHCRASACFGKMIDGMHSWLETESESTATRGELFLYGEQLALGYLGRQDLTDEKFVSRTINGKIQRCYKTGDIVEIIEDQLYFVARVDDLIKINGKQIDLLAIESIIVKTLERESYIVFTDETLCLCIQGNWDGNLVNLRNTLSESLETHEMPSKILNIAHFPKSANDKIDKQALKQLAKNHAN